MSKLLRFGFTATAASNEKSGDTKAKGTQATKQRYEQFKRKRSFVSSWLETFDWLRYDDDIGEMFCRLCEKFAPEKSSSFVTGCSNFRLDSKKSPKVCRSCFCLQQRNDNNNERKENNGCMFLHW